MNETNETNEKTNPQSDKAASSLSVRKLTPIVLIISGMVVFMTSGGLDYVSYEMLSEHREDILDWCEANMILSIVVYIGFYTLITAFSIPGAVWISIAGGFIFGLWQGAIFAVIAATCGAVLIFLAARYAAADYFHAKAGPTLHRMEEGFCNNALSYLLFLRLVPVFPFWLVNLVPALLGVPLKTYVIATFFGIMPGALVFTWVGSGLGDVLDRGEMPDLGIIFEPAFLYPIIGLALLSITPIIYKHFKSSAKDGA